MEFQLWGFFYFTLNCFYLLTTADRTVFRSDSQAKAIFLRPKRANSFLLEEILKGNLERECYEEKCTKEEAREVFEDNQKTVSFDLGTPPSKNFNNMCFNIDGDQCQSNPCQHGGTCKDKIGGYSCRCTDMYTGDNCEKDVSECPSGGPLGCEQFCRSLHDSYRCFCARGYTLHSDGRSCTPLDKDSCGRVLSDDYISKSKDQNDSICPQGKCPWQVTFMGVGGKEICHGVLLGRKSILTSAACLAKDVDSLVIVHSNEKINSSQVTERIAHDRYIIGKPADDLAFFVLKEPIALGSGPIQLCLPEKDFSENILMKHGKEGMTVGATNKPSYLPLDICQSKLNLSFSLTNKMFCMEKQEPEGMSKRSEEKKIECDLASGSPVATMEGNTAFLTGLFMSQSDCTQGLVFTKISRYLPWIRNLLRKKETVQR